MEPVEPADDDKMTQMQMEAGECVAGHCVGLTEDECTEHICRKWPDRCPWLTDWM